MRLRLAVFRSNKSIYGQVIDDEKGQTLAAASEKDLGKMSEGKKPTKSEIAKMVGKILAQRATKRGIKEVKFDRRGYKYHGRVKALAEGAREGGLQF